MNIFKIISHGLVLLLALLVASCARWDDPTEDGMTRRRPASSEPHPAMVA